MKEENIACKKNDGTDIVVWFHGNAAGKYFAPRTLVKKS